MALVKYNNNSISDITTAGQVAIGSLVPIKTLTASSSATLSFVHGTDGVVLDSTYPIYKFEFINCHPSTDSTFLTFNMSTDGGSTYAVTKTSTFFLAYHLESNDADTSFGYGAAEDLAQSTDFQKISTNSKNDNDIGISGTLEIYNPSSSNFVKHFMARTSGSNRLDYQMDVYSAGYGNTTSAVNAIRFQMSSGNIDSGKIKLYGIKDS